MKLYKEQVRHILEYSQLTWMICAHCHLSLLDQVHRRAVRLIQEAGGTQQQEYLHHHQQLQQTQQHRQRLQQQQHPRHTLLDSLKHRRWVGAITALHKAQVLNTPHLAALRVLWRRSQRSTRTVGSDLLLEVPRTLTNRCQRTFTCATTTVWNVFTAVVDVARMTIQQVKTAAHTCFRLHPPDSDKV